jgi:putative tryptophan/tyrosine transport system substrate-binding protein
MATRGARGAGGGRIPRFCFLTFEPGTPKSTRFIPWTDYHYRLPLRGWSRRAVSRPRRRLPAIQGGYHRRKDHPGRSSREERSPHDSDHPASARDPVATRLVASLARPGGNVTGPTQISSGLSANLLELLKMAVPSVSRVIVLSYLIDPIAAPQVKELESAPTPWG